MTPRILLSLVPLLLACTACRKSRTVNEVSQDSLLVRDADVPGADHKIRQDRDIAAADKVPPVDSRRAHPAPRPTDDDPVSASSNRCDSPRAHDQHACLKGLIAQSDVGLDNTYHELLVAIDSRGEISGDRREARLAISRLRAAERQWLDYRDKECRRRTYETEGKLWARTRGKCLAEFSERRRGELRQNLEEVRRGR